MENKDTKKDLNRRKFLRFGFNTFAGFAVGGVAGIVAIRAEIEDYVWQLDPNICVQCEKCSENCVLTHSAVKCVHAFSMCGYCDLCSGYLEPGAKSRDTAAESQLCPTGAIKRTFIEEPYFEYTIDEELCIGCGKCVKGCSAFGNGSLHLQVRHDRCLNCNECSIARSCPSQAYRRVPASQPYLMRGEEGKILIKKQKSENLMTKFRILIVLYAFFMLWNHPGYSDVVERFPKPDFKSDYTYPQLSVPDPRSLAMEYVDLFVLIVTLSLASYFALRTRSRKHLFILMVFSLIYFGFYREGCICPIGAVQNVTLALFDPGYVMPLTALGFFTLPLLFTLFFGRTFCASVCPLGAIQDVVILKPTRVPTWLETPLRLLPYLYLGLAVLFAATGAGFIICQYDPFVGFFRFSATFNIIIFGLFLLLLGTVVARPYCRYLCPLSVLLNWFSRVSRKHVNITPSECNLCRLCEESCPFEAINMPVVESGQKSQKKNVRAFIISVALVPIIVVGCGWVVSNMHIPLSRQHPTVFLADEILLEDSGQRIETTLETRTFRASGKPKDELLNEAVLLRQKFKTGSWYLGIFIGLVFSVQIVLLSKRIHYKLYHANTGRCLSCGRCFAYCPFEQIRRDPSKRESILNEL